jgi:hydroxypyruvate isomerase
MSHLRQSFSWWCYANRGLEPEALLAAAAKIGYEAVDLIGEEFWPLVKKHGLRLAAMNGHGTIENGLNRPENAKRIEEELKVKIANAAKWEVPALICFSGNRGNLDDKVAIAQCAETLSRIAPVARDAGVMLIVELLNSKVDHRDYQCDHTAWGVELIKQVNSPAVKLLYDIYHMQIMEGDVIRTIQQNHEHFGYYHTAGNPGRCQPDEHQELNYPPIYAAILTTGYRGFISHEFYPKGDVRDALARAFEQCAAVSG